ncbi:MAG: translocation/assembly module TamB domain-containing protein, partial [Ignavibacteria bacterium]
GSGNKKLNLRGNSERFDLTGDLVLVKGNITFNPFGKEIYNIYSDDFNYGLYIDSVKKDGTVIEKVLKENSDSTVILKNEILNPFEKIKYLSEHRDEIVWESKKKGGKFFYDVTVVTSGNVFLKFIVNEKSQQEFFGEIKTNDLNVFNTIDYSMMGRGTVTLGDNCYYKFFRKFDATGSTTFTGNISNPRLNINAQYKGYASSGTDAEGQQVLDDVIIDLRVTGEASSPNLIFHFRKTGIREMEVMLHL